jgi:hypothetical protein
MLPHFPKAHKQMTDIRDDKIWEGFYSASPILSQIGMRQQREGRECSVQDEQGTIQQINYQPTNASVQCKVEEARGLTLEDYLEIAREPAAEMGKQVVRRLYEMIHETATKAGNVVDAGGRPFTYDLFLEILEKVQFDFNADGSPIWPSLNLGSEAYAKFKRQWPEWLKDENFYTRLSTVIDRKREEFYEREACRRLVD